MIDAPVPTRAQVLDRLMQWLPGLYRARDVEAGGPLRAYLSLFADELWLMRQTIEQRYADHFIDSAQDWAIAYLAELVGTDILYTGTAAARPQIARLNRDDVKNTVAWRRRKGTLGAMQDMARGVGGWGAHASEMFERTACLQNLSHIRKQAVFAADLRDGAAVAQLRTPFTQARALADIRRPTQRTGWYQTRNVCVFEWPIESHPLAGITPFDLGGGRYTFHPLGLDTGLYAGCDSEAERSAALQGANAEGADIARGDSNDLPIRVRDLRANAGAYVGTSLGFSLREDGIALLGSAAPDSPSIDPCTDFAQLAHSRGMLAADTSIYSAGCQFEWAAVRLGALLHLVNGMQVPVDYSPGNAFVAQLQLRNPQGRLALDTVMPSFDYTPGVAPYSPDSGEYHLPVLLMRITNVGAANAAFPESEAIVRNARGSALQIALPDIAALAPNEAMHLYVATDGSTYFARADHASGMPDRNPDASIFGAYDPRHLARASDGQRRSRPGRPAGSARFARLVARELCCWDQPPRPALAPGEIAIDPVRGRIRFPASEWPTGELSVDFRYGLTAEIGAGPFARDESLNAQSNVLLISVARHADADFDNLQAAIDSVADGQARRVVIAVLDSAVYEESLSISGRSLPGGLSIQAAPSQMPLLRRPAAATNLMTVSGSTMPMLSIEGLLMAGGPIRIDGAVDAIRLHNCTLQPDTCSLVIGTANIDLQLRQCISGPISASTSGSIMLDDCIVQHPSASIEIPAAGKAIDFATGSVALEACTLIGTLLAAHARISNSLCWGDAVLADIDASCLRYSRLPRTLLGRAFASTQATPMFLSISLGDAGYAHLHPNSAAALLNGGEEGGEIGAFAGAGLPWRTQNTGLRLNEAIPAGMTAVQVRVLPTHRRR